MSIRILFIAGFLLLNAIPSFANVANQKNVLDNPIIASFINDMVKKHQFDRQALNSMFSTVKLMPEIIEKMTRPAESLPWHRYKNIFLKDKRIDQGIQFWNENTERLQQAEKKFGVPAQIIVAILGVETRYGRITGGYRLIDSLSTIVIDYPKRRSFFKKELEQLLLLAREESFDPLSLTGSYAGAMGKPQFIASSYRHYAIDFDGDGVRDLLNNTADAIGSIASYLSRHGWQRGNPVTIPATVSNDSYKRFLKKGMKPKVALNKIDSYGVSVKSLPKKSLNASLVELEQESGNEYWLGLPNFYAITRYNHSNLYAMAVFQLSEAVKLKREQKTISLK